MNHSLEQDIRARLDRYLAGEQSMAEFQRWFIPASWNVHRSGNPAVEGLVGEVGLLLAEFEAGDRSEDELRKHFRPLAKDRSVRST
ncbi:MAG: hypothetical protein ACRDJE_25645 [Dehalococcoidia bacterium]